jgi:gliding motility-associated-like protein
VQRDSVEVLFKTRVRANATTFDAWVSLVGTGARQGVRPAEQHSATVFVPAVASGGALIRSVEVTSLVTPNGDGVNDVAAIRFALAKVESAVPEVTIHDLSGRLVRAVSAGVDGYGWDGRDSTGKMLPPGVYICRIAVAADVGERSVRRIINLAY